MEDVILSDNFKTNYIYKFQPVTITVLINLYVQYIRPNTDDTEFLFLTCKGTQLGQGYVGKGVNSFFALFGLDLNITAIRKLIEVCTIILMSGLDSTDNSQISLQLLNTQDY